MPVGRPRVSRETRLLVTTAVLAVIALWLLARLRYPEAAVSQPAVPPLLATLAPRQGFADLSEQLADLAARVSPGLLSLEVTDGELADRPRHVAVLRLRDDIGVALLEAGDVRGQQPRAAVRARDPVTGLAILTVPRGPSPPPSTTSSRRDSGRPRYLMRSVASASGTSLLPVATSALTPVEAPLWLGSLWALSPATEVMPGVFVFTAEGELIGLTVRHQGGPAVVPLAMLAQHAERLLGRAGEPLATLGVALQPLTPGLTRLTGATRGVAVSWVAPDGPAVASLRVGDVLEAGDGRPLPTVDHWRRHLADLRVGTPTTVSVHRDGAIFDAELVPVAAGVQAPPPDRSARPLGLTVTRLAGVGAAITAVQSGSIADAAGLRVGDRITMIGTLERPTPAQIRRAMAAAPPDRPVLVAIERGSTHHLATLEP